MSGLTIQTCTTRVRLTVKLHPQNTQLTRHLAKTANLDVLPGVYARAPNEGAVDVRLRHDAGDVVRLHRASVKDTDSGGHRVAEPLGESPPDRAAYLLGIVGRGHLPGADRPDRLVRHDDRLHLVG